MFDLFILNRIEFHVAVLMMFSAARAITESVADANISTMALAFVLTVLELPRWCGRCKVPGQLDQRRHQNCEDPPFSLSFRRKHDGNSSNDGGTGSKERGRKPAV